MWTKNSTTQFLNCLAQRSRIDAGANTGWFYSLYSIARCFQPSPGFVEARILSLPPPLPPSCCVRHSGHGQLSAVTANLSPPSSQAPRHPQTLIQSGKRKRMPRIYLCLSHYETKPFGPPGTGASVPLLLSSSCGLITTQHSSWWRKVLNTRTHSPLLVQRALLIRFLSTLLPSTKL